MRSVAFLAFIATLPFLLHSIAHIAGIEIRLLGSGGVLGVSSLVDKSEFAAPTYWQERAYLAANVDVAEAVNKGSISSGFEHYMKFGKQEGRPLAPSEMQSTSAQPANKDKAATDQAASSVLPPTQAATTSGNAYADAAPEIGASNASSAMSTSAESPLNPPNSAAGATVGKVQGRYVVQQGGSLATIAGLAKVQVAELMALNPDLPAGWLPTGTVVNLPVPWPVPFQMLDKARPGVPVPLPSLKPSPSAAERSSGVVIRQIRFGVHTDAVRLVLDVSGQTPFHVSVRADGKALFIEIPQVAWAVERHGQAPKNSVLSSYAVEGGPAISRLIVSSREVIQIKMAKLFPPNETAGHRIVVDVEQAPHRASAR